MAIKKVKSTCRICGNDCYIPTTHINTLSNMCSKCYKKLDEFEISFKKRIQAPHHKKPVGECTWEEFRRTLLIFKFRCAYSNVELTLDNWEIEHLHPTTDKERSSTTAPNLLPVTKNINHSKQDKDFIVWYTPKLSYYSEARKEYILKNHYYPAIETRNEAQTEAEEHYRRQEEKRQEKEALKLKAMQEFNLTEEEYNNIYNQHKKARHKTIESEIVLIKAITEVLEKERKRKEEIEIKAKKFMEMKKKAEEEQKRLMTPNRIAHMKRYEKAILTFKPIEDNKITWEDMKKDIFDKPFVKGAEAEVFSLGRIDFISVDNTRTRYMNIC